LHGGEKFPGPDAPFLREEVLTAAFWFCHFPILFILFILSILFDSTFFSIRFDFHFS